MENLKGGQQFFSNYLKAFRETVDKQTEMVTKLNDIYIRLNDAVPKFAIPSNNIMKSDYTIKRVPSGQSAYKFISYVNGQVKIIVSAKATNTALIEILVNGIKVYSTPGLISTYNEFDYIISLNEGDKVELKVNGMVDVDFNKLELLYDLVSKPDLVLN